MSKLMATREKSRRKLTIHGRLYVWYVKEDYDSSSNVLHVLSDDKQFIVHYHLGQQPEFRYITIFGREFARTTGTGGCWRRFRCPEWVDKHGVITPGAVRKLIEWCDTSSEQTTEVDQAGRAVPLGGCCPVCGVDLRGMIPICSNRCHKCGHAIAERAGEQEHRFGNE